MTSRNFISRRSSSILVLALMMGAAHATTLSSMSIGGQTIPCDGTDHYLMFMPVCPPQNQWSIPTVIACQQPDQYNNSPGGGHWPGASFTVWSTNYTVITSDPTAQSVVGLLGAGGDTLTPVMVGAGATRQVEPYGRPFNYSADRFDFHVKCSTGGYAIIQGAIEYSVP